MKRCCHDAEESIRDDAFLMDVHVALMENKKVMPACAGITVFIQRERAKTRFETTLAIAQQLNLRRADATCVNRPTLLQQQQKGLRIVGAEHTAYADILQ
jgi:hypothetical protein